MISIGGIHQNLGLFSLVSQYVNGLCLQAGLLLEALEMDKSVSGEESHGNFGDVFFAQCFCCIWGKIPKATMAVYFIFFCDKTCNNCI